MDAALAAGTIATWSWDIVTDRFYGDPTLARLFALPEMAVAGGPLAAVAQAIHPEDRERVMELVNRAIASGDRYESDYRVQGANGTWRWVTARGKVERDAQGRPLRFPGVVMDVTERKEAEVALERVRIDLERGRRLYETALSNTPDLVYVFDLQHRFTFANDALLAMWGKTWSESIGKTCLELGYEPWHAAMHDAEIEQVRATKQAIRGEVPFTGVNGRRMYDYIFVPVLDAHGEVEAVAGSTRDVTERQAMEQELREADRKKDDFIAMLAHELRNPLAPIRNGVHVLRHSNDPAVRERTQQVMERQLSHMVRLIDDLLDVSRVSRNKLELRRTHVTLSEVIAAAIETAGPAIEAEGHELTVALPDVPIMLDADLTRLAQVFGNLLTNSAKYTPRGGRIAISAERSAGQVAVAVRDSGVGIPAESLPTIFNMFSQVDRTLERTSGGLGIGLALVKGLVELHGGTVTGSSAGRDLGSTFTVTLPLAETAASAVATPASEAPTAGPRHRILVVDDNQDGAETMAEMLALLGHEVRMAHDGHEAIASAEAFRPALILMDIGMPRVNGLDATRSIRAQPWGQDMVVIALTGWGQDNDRERSRAAGCNGHLVKPVGLPELQKVLGDFEP